MTSNRFMKGLLLAAGLAAAVQAPLAADSITAKSTQETYFLYRQNFGAYGKVDKPLREVQAFVRGKGLEGPIVGIYYDVTARTAPSLQKADLGIAISAETAQKFIRETHPDATEEELQQQLDSDRGTPLEDSYFIKVLPSRLVAAKNVKMPFLEFVRVYEQLQNWSWKNGYFVIGPVIEIYASPVYRNKAVSAQVQIGIQRSGVPDRR